MKDSNFFDEIEKLNLEYLEIKESEEYLNGLKSKNLKKMIKGFHFITILKKIKMELGFRKYNRPVDYKLISINNAIDKNAKIVVYSCITGSYDSVYEPAFNLPNVEYILFSDTKIKTEKWKNIVIPKEIIEKYNSNILVNRYYKMNPHEVFKDNNYDYSIYVDGNVKIISNIAKLVTRINKDYGIAFHYHSARKCIYNEGKLCKITKKGNKANIDKQLKRYKEEGFPSDYGMTECNVIVSDLNNKESKKILTEWWNEFLKSESFRDQLSLPYVLWKNNIKIESIATLGLSVFKNPIVRVERNHKK